MKNNRNFWLAKVLKLNVNCKYLDKEVVGWGKINAKPLSLCLKNKRSNPL